MRYYSKRFAVYYYPGHWIQYQSCTHSAPSQLPGEHSGQAGATSLAHTCHIKRATNNVRILPDTHVYTWVEHLGGEQRCELSVLLKGKRVPGIDGNRTRNPLIQSQGSVQYTTAPPSLCVALTDRFMCDRCKHYV